MAPRRVLTDSPFDTLEKTFDLLVTGPNPLALDGTWLDGLADRAIPLGAALMAAEAGVVLADLSWRRSLVHDLAASQASRISSVSTGSSAPCSDPLAPARLSARRVVVRTALRPGVG